MFREATATAAATHELLVPGRVTAAAALPAAAAAAPLEPDALRTRPDVQQISVEMTRFGTIDLTAKSKEIWSNSTHWVRAIRLSDDCHSYNVQLRLQPRGLPQPTHRPSQEGHRTGSNAKLIVQAVRPVEAGQELLLWFSEDVLAMLQVVFLRPCNIQGQKKYVCTRCSALYESPNPLKLHITLGCGRSSINSLWEKLANMLRENSYQEIIRDEFFNFKLSPEPQIPNRQRNALDLSLSTASESPKNIYRPFSENSAFKPFKKEDNLDSIPLIPTVWPVTLETDTQFHSAIGIGVATSQNVHDEAQIETLVSSLGKAKQGHICLYCGKCYSRKYGLKIHIRTHTGYKPLRCKFCDRPFGDPSNLNKHVRLHAGGNTPYKYFICLRCICCGYIIYPNFRCDLCGKILVRRRDLERHLKSRHMIEMHPGVNILPDSPSEENVLSEDESKNETKNDG